MAKDHNGAVIDNTQSPLVQMLKLQMDQSELAMQIIHAESEKAWVMVNAVRQQYTALSVTEIWSAHNVRIERMKKVYYENQMKLNALYAEIVGETAPAGATFTGIKDTA